jgi:hypothetical protein
MTYRSRIVVFTAAAVLLALVAGWYVLGASNRAHPATRSPGGTDAISLSRPGQLLFRNGQPGPRSDRLAAVSRSDPAGPRSISDLSCVRFSTAAGTGVCLTVERSAIPKIYALVLDRDLKPVRRVSLPGAPSRARVSASGRMVAWTVFTSGDSYTSTNLSTRTGILDTRTGRVVQSLEDFTLIKDGKKNHDPSLNYWGVTFTADDDHFYATVRVRGTTTYLVEGSMSTRTLRTLRENVECPSLSPDGGRLVFKKATGDPAHHWRLTVLDLRTMRETPLAEPASVDDQAAWLDDRTVMYGRVDGSTPDIWAVPADGGGAPRLLVRNGFSPAVVP